MTQGFIDTSIWKKKATAFVTRSHRHLWGKNNEDPLACLFMRGLKNDFIKEHYLGWNKFAQKRPLLNWGFEPEPDLHEKFFLPSGIVIPFIVDKNLISVFIQSFNKEPYSHPTLLPGSSSATMVLGQNKETIIIIKDLFDGLFLFQETGQACSVFIHPDPDLPFCLPHQSTLQQASHIHVLSKKNENKQKTIQSFVRKDFPELPENAFAFYESKDDLIHHLL